MHLPVTYNAADGQGFTKWFRKTWNILRAGVCLHTATGQAQEGDHTCGAVVTLKIPLQGQLLFPVAATERVAGPGLPEQPHPHCPRVKTMRLFLPSSAEEAGIELSLAERPESLKSLWDCLGCCCLKVPSLTSCSTHGAIATLWTAAAPGFHCWKLKPGCPWLEHSFCCCPSWDPGTVLAGVSSSAVQQQPGNALQLLSSSC